MMAGEGGSLSMHCPPPTPPQVWSLWDLSVLGWTFFTFRQGYRIQDGVEEVFFLP